MANLTLHPFPTVRAPSATSWGLTGNSGFLAPGSNNFQQGIKRSGDAYVATRSYRKLPLRYGQVLGEFMDGLVADPGHRFRLPDDSFQRRGSLGVSEAVSNGSGLADASGWTAAGSAVLSANGGQLKVLNGAAAAGIATQPLTLVNGAKYLLRCAVEDGAATAWKAGIGSASGLFDIASATGTAPGEAFLAFTAGAANWISLQLNDTTAGHEIYFDQVSVSRCLTIHGASQSGQVLLLKDAPPSTNGLIARGDFLQLDTDQLLRAANDGDSDSSGYIRLKLRTWLRAAPTDAAGVALYAPSTKFMLPPGPQGLASPASNSPPAFSDFSITCVEDIYAKQGGA